MKTQLVALLLLAWPVSGQINQLEEQTVKQMFGVLEELDFENQPFDGVTPANPVVLDRATFSSPNPMGFGFCSSPTCEPDPENLQAGNIVLFLPAGANVLFDGPPGIVALDVQGMGANPFNLLVTDGGGRTERMTGQGVMFGVHWLGVSSPAGISRIQLESVGGTGGPLVLARVLYSAPIPEPSTLALGSLSVLVLACCRGRFRGL